MPEKLDWTRLAEYEKEDNTKSSQTFACTGDVCEVVDITQELDMDVIVTAVIVFFGTFSIAEKYLAPWVNDKVEQYYEAKEQAWATGF